MYTSERWFSPRSLGASLLSSFRRFNLNKNFGHQFTGYESSFFVSHSLRFVMKFINFYWVLGKLNDVLRFSQNFNKLRRCLHLSLWRAFTSACNLQNGRIRKKLYRHLISYQLFSRSISLERQLTIQCEQKRLSVTRYSPHLPKKYTKKLYCPNASVSPMFEALDICV